MIQEFARVLRDKIRTDMNNYADDIAGGACRTFDEYQKLCGIISGLALAERYLLDLQQKVEESNE
tara:strand:- start:332 stop:526 length:195 start_codon:yes stop_codon:yes gene_type:complete